MPSDHWLTMRQAAERAQVSTRTISRAIRAGELDVGGTRRLVRIRPEKIDQWLERRG